MDIKDDYKQLNINVSPGLQCYASDLDFTDYSHGGADITKPVYCALQATNMPRSSTSYYQTPMLIGTNDFTLTFRVNASFLEQHPTCGMGGGHFALILANLITTTTQQASLNSLDGIVFSMRAYKSATTQTPPCTDYYLMQIRSRYGGTENYHEYNGQLNTDYDITITRTNMQVVMSISSGGILLWDTSTEPITDNTDIQYFVPMCGRGDTGVPNQLASAIMSNYNISYQSLFEDFSSYTHLPAGDPYLSLYPNNYSITATNIPRSATCYIRKPAPIGTGNFTLTFTLNASDLQTNPNLGGVGGTLSLLFTNLSTTTDEQISYLVGDGLLFTFREYTCGATDPGCTPGQPVYLLQVRSRKGTTTEYWQEVGGALNTTYIIEIIRDIAQTRSVKLNVYDSSGTLLHVATIKDSTDIQYFLPRCGRGGGGAGTLLATGIAQNFTLTY